MQIWAGLGNPGAQYALHRHNVGFMAADAIAEVHGFGSWQKKFRSLASEEHAFLQQRPDITTFYAGDGPWDDARIDKLVDALETLWVHCNIKRVGGVAA